MAIPSEITQLNEQPVVTSPKKRSRRRRGRKNKNSMLDAGSSASSDDSSTGSSPSSTRSRRRRQPPTKKAKNKAPALSQEEQAKYVALDCEMVGVGLNGYKSALARVTMVDWSGDIVLDQYIQPDRPVTDFRTHVSGITAADLEDAVDLETCRERVLSILQDRILVGHALKNDLAALGIRHPWYMTRDTAKYEPFMKVRFDDGILWPRKLKELVSEKLGLEIQVPGRPHCPVEDAVAALSLYKAARTKWEKVMDYKISKTRQIEEQKLLQLAQ